MSLEDYARTIDADGNPIANPDRNGSLANIEDEMKEIDKASKHLGTDVLNRLFKENPDNMTRAIQAWLHESDDNSSN